MRKKLPIGIDGFDKLRTNDFYYADKSMFIAELLRNWGEVNLFTRPRRFGKTLNMSMLKCFFEIGGDAGLLFDGLDIMQEKELCEKYMGQFPVIFISLKSVDGLDFHEASAALRTVIGDEAVRLQFLVDSDNLSDIEKERYRALVRMDKGSYVMQDDVLTDSLKILSQLLAKHYVQRVVA